MKRRLLKLPLYLPLELFTAIYSVLTMWSTADAFTWVNVIPPILMPYLFLFFTGKSLSGAPSVSNTEP